MRNLVRLVVLIALLAGACQNRDTASTAPPDFSVAAADELRARAYQSACLAVLCAGFPMYTPAGDQDLLDAIAHQFSDEVVALTYEELEELTGTDGRYSDGGTYIAINRVYKTEHSDVAAVDVFVSRGFLSGEGRTVLFKWNGTTWDESTPGETGITVTTAVP